MKILVLLCILALTQSNMFRTNLTHQNYAILIAGSNSFWNYRHQADILHAYHILTTNGMPKDNIIVFAYDDIANDKNNPFPGKIFNKPDPNGKGVDVYQGVPIDYKGNDITTQVFLNVLEGNSTAVKGKGTERVLTSKADDHVFIYFSDHGATGLIEFPDLDGFSQFLYADELMKTLTKMHTNKMYKQLVFYLEACESGSMFEMLLSEDLNIYATTAASPYESSFEIYCNGQDVIDGKEMGTCLGDEYSVNWMEDSDANLGLTESLQWQFDKVKLRTKESHPHEYGDMTFVTEDIGQFQGYQDSSLYGKAKRLFGAMGDYFTTKDEAYTLFLEQAKNSTVDSRYAKLNYLERKKNRTNTFEDDQEYFNELKHINRVDSIFTAFSNAFLINPTHKVLPTNFDCLRSAMNTYRDQCGWGEYELKYVKYLVHACEKGVRIDGLIDFFGKICLSNEFNGPLQILNK
jgi:legumain